MYAVYLGGCACSGKNGIREADLQYEVPEVRSPYLEVSFYDLNTQTVEQTAVEVNPFYRFFDIFSGVLDINQKEYGKQRKSLWMRYFIIWR